MLDILQDFLELRSYSFERIDGNVTGRNRQNAIDRYCAPDSSSLVMLLSTKAGGVGESRGEGGRDIFFMSLMLLAV